MGGKHERSTFMADSPDPFGQAIGPFPGLAGDRQLLEPVDGLAEGVRGLGSEGRALARAQLAVVVHVRNVEDPICFVIVR